MEEKLPIREHLFTSIVRKRSLVDDCLLSGRFDYELERKNKIITSGNIHNTITTPMKNKFLDVFFKNAARNNNGWYMSLISNEGYSNTSPNDTVESHNGWSEFASYLYNNDPGTAAWRAWWTPGNAYNGAIGNASVIEFNITANGELRGIYILGYGGTSGVKLMNPFPEGSYGLWCTALLTAALPVEIEDIFRVFYTVQI